jgi:hypothetical protein
MIKSSQKRNQIANNYAKYLISCEKIRNQSDVNLTSLQRVLQLNGKTTLLNGKVLTFCLRLGEIRIKITHTPKNALNTHYFLINVSNKPNLNLEVSAENTKQLMYKINHVYKLLKPIQDV